MTDSSRNKTPLEILAALDRFEGPGFLHESAQLAEEVIERLQELKDSGLLYSEVHLREWFRELIPRAFAVLQLSAADPPPLRNVLMVRDLYFAVEADYKANRKNVQTLKSRWAKHLEPVFGEKAVSEIRHEAIFLYTEHRREQGAAPATINRELAILKRMYKLAIRMGRLKLGQMPYVGMQREDNARAGFLKDEQYEALARETQRIGNWFRATFELAYVYGWRKSELLNLKVEQLNFGERTISLAGKQTKSRRPRFVVMTDKVFELLSPCAAGKAPGDYVITRPPFEGGFLYKYQHKSSTSKYWFMRYVNAEGQEIQRSTKTTDEAAASELLRLRLQETGTVRRERRVMGFRDEWPEVCKQAGCEGLLFHDLRRTAVRNMVRDGVPEKVAMMISGHLTRSVFDRYHIVSEEDLKDASRKMQTGAARRHEQARVFFDTSALERLR